MRKIYLIIGLMAVTSFSLIAQSLQSIEEKNAERKKAQNPELMTERFSQKAGTYGSMWMNWGEFIDTEFTGGEAALWVWTVFPDSAIIRDFSTTTGEPIYPFRHAGATVIDPTAIDWDWLTEWSTYTLDSISVYYSYSRNTDASVVDTLRIDVLKHSTQTGAFADTNNPHTWQVVPYEWNINQVPESAILETIKVPLTESDTTDNSGGQYSINYIDVASSHSYLPGERIGASVSFIPGYSYSITDTLDNYNRLFLASFEENGEDTDPIYWGNMNYSYILPRMVRYNQSGPGNGNWNGQYIPTVAYTTPFEAEHHLIYFKVTATNDVGVESNVLNGIKLEQNAPNPFNNTTFINYSLDQFEPEVILEVHDIAGRLVFSDVRQEVQPGNYRFELNAGMNQGTYFYSLVTNSGRLTKQMVVVK